MAAVPGIPSAGKFSRGYKGGRRSSDIDSRPPSEDYRRGCDLMGWNRLTTYCQTCGRLPAWCECKAKEQHG